MEGSSSTAEERGSWLFWGGVTAAAVVGVAGLGLLYRRSYGGYTGPDGRKQIGAEMYEGEMVNGKANGFGRSWTPEGDEYVGYWRDDEPHGHGKILFKGGQTFEGDFAENRAWKGASFFLFFAPSR